MPIRTAIIEDNESFAMVFHNHFKRPGSEVLCVAVYGTAEEALKKLPAESPQVAMVDINLPGMSGIECIARLRELCPELLCIVLTTFEEDTLIFEALKAGACGYLLKRSSPEELMASIKDAVSGGAPMSPQIARQVVTFFHKRPPCKHESTLSPREREIIDLLASGLLYKEIAEKLDLKFETVRSYVKKIYEKLQAHSRMEAVTKWKRGSR
jgi:DNA-binding NarL/FixJ family response regulator